MGGVRMSDVPAHLRNIGVVFQSYALFPHMTVADNIAFPLKMAKKDPAEIQKQVSKLLEDVRLAQFGNRFPHELSGGQRQRIGIARAIIRDSPILILDEPTAALDTESEKIVMDALEKLMAGRTVITIAHRLSTIYNSDKIIVIRDGEIAEEGNHEALLIRGELYAELYHIQTKVSTSHAGATNFVHGSVLPE